jgi:NTE family protein
MNAVVMASGLLAGGNDAARERLEALWRSVAGLGRLSPLSGYPLDPGGSLAPGNWPGSQLVLDLLSRVISPYQFNPLDFNPLRDVLEDLVDFKALRRQRSPALYISATEVATGSVRIFESKEISPEVLLASACLPHLHQAVKVGRGYYWDGGYSSNPALLPLVRGGHASDSLIVQLNPSRQKDVPTSAQEIAARLNTLTFNAPLKREIEVIEQCRAVAGEGFAIGGTLRRRLRRHRFHLIEAAKATKDLGPETKLHPSWEVLTYLRDAGRDAAKGWMGRNFAALGSRGTVDLGAKFL